MHLMESIVLPTVMDAKDTVLTWLSTMESQIELPLYTSVDIRHSEFKSAVVDTNLFPAGFNNLTPQDRKAGLPIIRDAILARQPNCRHVLIIAEEHTRNKWYLENAFVLQSMIRDAGFEVQTATFLDPETEPECTKTGFVSLETALGNTIHFYCLKTVLDRFSDGVISLDFILLNNDLTTGAPPLLRDAGLPIYPSYHAGWHARLKSNHFLHANLLIAEFCHHIGLDPWLLTCLFESVSESVILDEENRSVLAQKADSLIEAIQKKYDAYGVNQTPLVFLKADSGTYGMGVVPIESGRDILALNRKNRTKLSVGKSAQAIRKFILQEGIPSAIRVNHHPAEFCLYQVSNRFIGGFYRVNNQKSLRENLNSTGMSFVSAPRTELIGLSGQSEATLFLYQVLARLSGLAASREIALLESHLVSEPGVGTAHQSTAFPPSDSGSTAL